MLAVIATNPETARSAKRSGADRIYVPALNYRRGQASYAGCVAQEPTQAGFPKHCTVMIPSVVHDPVGPSREAAIGVDPWAYAASGEPVYVESLGAIMRAADMGAFPEVGPNLPVTNASSVDAVEALGAICIWLSPELNLKQIGELTSSAPQMQFGVKIAGVQELMLTEHCMLMSLGPCSEKCDSCTRRRIPYALRDRKGYNFPISTDSVGRSHIYNSVELDNVPSVAQLQEAGIDSFMLDATLLTPEQTAQQTARLRDAINGVETAKRPNATTGHLYRGVL